MFQVQCDAARDYMESLPKYTLEDIIVEDPKELKSVLFPKLFKFVPNVKNILIHNYHVNKRKHGTGNKDNDD